MEKQKRWQLIVIVLVFVLTLYNILPTIIYYSKPLKKSIGEKEALLVEESIGERVNSLEPQAIDWLNSFCNLLSVSPKSIQFNQKDPLVINVEFKDKAQADTFRRFLPTAGLEIPFVPAQVGLIDDSKSETSVQVTRRLGLRFEKSDLAKLFRFSEKYDSKGSVAPFYFDLVSNRFEEVASNVNGGKAQALLIDEIVDNKQDKKQAIYQLAEKLVFVTETFGNKNPIAIRYFKTFGQQEGKDQSAQFNDLVSKFEDEKRALEHSKAALQEEKRKKEEKGELLASNEIEYSEYLQNQIKLLDKALSVMQKNRALFQSTVQPFTKKDAALFLKKSFAKDSSQNAVYTLVIGDRHPLFNELVLDFSNDDLLLRLHPDVQAVRQKELASEEVQIQQDMLNRWIMNEVARISQSTEELITADATHFRINLYKLPSSKSLLALDLPAVARKLSSQTLEIINDEWKPSHLELAIDKFPHFDSASFKSAPSDQKRLCLVVTSGTDNIVSGLREGSIYVVLRGTQSIMEQYKKVPDSQEAVLFTKEFNKLAQFLEKRGFIGYSGASLGLSRDLANDYVFELDDYYSTILKATREDFYVLGSKRYATLEFSDVEQRIITENRIGDAIQEDLLKWKEAYQAAQVDLNPMRHYTVPKPTENTYWANFKLSTAKYFRGDDSAILRWGLDLSGGKSVRIAITDHAGHRVEKQEELKQAANELYTRINKMGVSERTIRIEDSTILLDFPGSQGLSASELIKASAMYFHVVNEQFGSYNKALSKEVHEFLQDVWNEAVVTNRKDIESINDIAYQKFQMAATRETTFGTKSAAQTLYEKGLRLANPREAVASARFDDSVSTIARFRGDDLSEWSFQTHPLLIVFENYALEGANLEGVQTSYDPSKGNILLFSVKSSAAQGNPRDNFYSWTSQFAEETIVGTPREAYTQGRGYRMAVILNGTVISAPSLNSPLRDHAMISGNFSQREVSKLATDLKAGSLSFTPRILSEQNVSPELGVEERTKGIRAAIIGVLLVIVAMCSYYRLAGVVASIAVLVNVLIIWAVLQNMEAALTLPGIAGMVLTVGMAVDANVLVFERIREEFKISGRIASAIQAGYRKAFSAILDSNLTTILAAFILLQFDCGPIRAFAVTLIIGIISSMFTALFMTRYFFAGWVQNPKNRELKMAEWIRPRNFDFLKMAKPAFIISIVLFAVGAMVFQANWKSMIGMDFTGGYSLVVEVYETGKESLVEKTSKALTAQGINSTEFQIRELGRSNLLRLQLGISLEDRGHAFFGMPRELQNTAVTYEFQKNPRIVFIVKALESAGLKIKPSSLSTLSNNWTVMSGQFSDAMRNNAIIALSLALAGILIYIAFRFEWKYAVSSVLALLHDVLLTLAVMAIANRLGAPVQINLEVIGAIMTIIGYSLNDTIIVFDRIREDLRVMRKMSFPQVINHALNQTLSRTLMTSGTTLLVLLALDFFAGTSIFGFAFVMTVGVFLGTLSSLFIASPILLWLHNREKESSRNLSVESHVG